MTIEELLQDLAITFQLPNTQGTKVLLNYYKQSIEKIRDEEIIKIKKGGEAN